MEVEWPVGFDDSTESVMTKCSGPDIGSLYLDRHQPQGGHLEQLASLVGIESQALPSGTAEADAAPWKFRHPGVP